MRYVFGLLAALSLAVVAHAQHEQHHPQQQAQPQQRPAAGQDRQMQRGMGGKMQPMDMEQMMRDMPKEMKLKAQMMMHAQISAFDPKAVLALEQRLNLTDQQVQQLQQIAQQAQQQAKALFTEFQQQTLSAIPEKPATSMAMHRTMMQRMMQKMKMQPQAEAGQREEMNCPMMMMVTPTTQPVQKDQAAPAGHDAHGE